MFIPNFMEIRRTIASLPRYCYDGFWDGGRPPSWIFKLQILTMPILRGSKCVIVPNFMAICRTVAKLRRFNGFWATVFFRPVLSDSCLLLSCPVCDLGVLWPNGWMDQHAAWHGARPRPRRHCFKWGPSFPHGKGHSTPPTFRPVSIVAKRSYC